MCSSLVHAARAAWRAGVWRDLAPGARAAVLRRLAAGLAAEAGDLARLEAADCGKPLREADWDLEDASACFEFYADLAESQALEEEVPLPEPGFRGRVRREPLGVVGLITPWNYPLLMACWKVAPALAAGCSVVLKPSEHASLTCLELARLAHAAGVPAGVLNVVTGLGAEAGAALAAHPGLAKVCFTGSSATGALVAAAAARRAVPCTLELGGKSALVIFDDADVEKAVEWAMFGCFWTNGQICSATSRVLVQDGVAPRFLERLARRAAQLKLAPPLDPEGQVGPLVCASQYRKVVGHIERARQSRARLLCGGAERPAGLGGGFYVRPTVFTDVPVDSALWTEEVFGPVMAVRTFASEREAVDLANASEFGLAAAVISRDRARCERLAGAFEAGIVWQNCSQPCFPQLPWGGGKRSGYGRELSKAGLENFQHVKQICTYESGDVWDWYAPPGPRAKL